MIVAIVDWMLPRRDGPSIVRAMRSAGVPTAVIMLTARGQMEDRVLGLDSGADDYLGKPFAFEELLARLRALGRRSAGPGIRALGTAQWRPGPRPGGRTPHDAETSLSSSRRRNGTCSNASCGIRAR